MLIVSLTAECIWQRCSLENSLSSAPHSRSSFKHSLTEPALMSRSAAISAALIGRPASASSPHSLPSRDLKPIAEKNVSKVLRCSRRMSSMDLLLKRFLPGCSAGVEVLVKGAFAGPLGLIARQLARAGDIEPVSCRQILGDEAGHRRLAHAEQAVDELQQSPGAVCRGA